LVLVFGVDERTAAINESALSTDWLPRPVMTSPACSPAASAPPPGVIWTIFAPVGIWLESAGSSFPLPADLLP